MRFGAVFSFCAPLLLFIMVVTKEAISVWVCFSLVGLGAIALVFYLLEKCKRYSLKGVLIKFVVSLLFVAVAVIASHLHPGHILNPLLIIGLVLGLSGDVWLDLKYVYPEHDKSYSYMGFAVFGLGHIFFITGMFLEFFGSAHPLYVILPLSAAIVIGVGNLFLAKPMKLDYGSMKGAVLAYSFCLFSMPLSALSLCILTSFQSVPLVLLFVGGILFAVSDLVLSGTYFGKGHERPIDFILNYCTYYPAQFLIALSLLFLA